MTTRYILKVVKIEEQKTDDFRHQQFPQERELFVGEMDSDQTIEIMQHLHSLEREKRNEG